jgi:hypothetical protein
MKAELVLNDLSIIEADSNDIARDWFTETFKVVAALIHQDVCKPLLRAQIELTDILLTDDYGFDEWLEELEYQDDLRLLAQKLNTDTPVNKFLKIIETKNDEFCRSEFHLKTEAERTCNALGVALISDGISLNLPSNAKWCLPFIEIKQTLYSESEELKPEKVIHHRVRSVSTLLHVDPVVRDWRHNIGKNTNNVDELLKCWKVAFSYLDLCCEYKTKFLPNLEGKTFKSVLKRLQELDDCCHDWSNKTEISYSMNVRPESKKTMSKDKLANLRLATCPNNGKKHFIMHCDIQPNGYRLYWSENQKMKRLTIGYAGPHLETENFKSQ